jgi:predicted molibdopterin-dependent oxidoreductase YjgC
VQALQGKTVYLVGVDPVNDDPRLAEALQAAEFVVVQDVMETATTGIADVVLPAQALPNAKAHSLPVNGVYSASTRRFL